MHNGNAIGKHMHESSFALHIRSLGWSNILMWQQFLIVNKGSWNNSLMLHTLCDMWHSSRHPQAYSEGLIFIFVTFLCMLYAIYANNAFLITKCAPLSLQLQNNRLTLDFITLNNELNWLFIASKVWTCYKTELSPQSHGAPRNRLQSDCKFTMLQLSHIFSSSIC